MMIEVLSGISIIVGVINLIFNILILKKVKFNEFRMQNQIGQTNQTGGVVFCRKCNSRYTATLPKCPVCGETRR